jgi:hypothetical protein
MLGLDGEDTLGDRGTLETDGDGMLGGGDGGRGA